MKNTLLLLGSFLFSSHIIAQPTITLAEAYSIGDTIKFGDCPATAPGAAGAAVTWNFSSLAPTDTSKLWILANPAGSPYPTANIIERYSDSTYYFVNKTTAQNNVAGTIDSSVSGGNNAITYTNNMLTVQRPFTYGTTVTDTFSISSTYVYMSLPVPVTGSGTIVLTGDGYGTLTLPTGTFTNVLRVKSIQHSASSGTVGPLTGTFNESLHTYSWYEAGNTVPLLVIDSLADTTTLTSATISSSVSVKYFLTARHPLNTPMANTGSINVLKGNISNNQLSLFGVFDQGKVYDVSLYDIIGRKIFNDEFVANGNIPRFEIEKQMVPGLYIVNLAEKNDPSSQQIIKVTK